MKSIIEEIQEDDPSYDPLEEALSKTHGYVSRKLWHAACDRVYYDGYYGPISSDDWKEQDGRKPYTVKEAIEILAKVLGYVEPYYDDDRMVSVEASEIRAALVPFYKEIYGVRYPS